MLGVYTHPKALFAAEMATLAHATWILAPLTIGLGVWALARFLRRGEGIGARYAHAGAVVLLWLVWLGAVDEIRRYPGWAVAGPAWLDLAGFTLTLGSAAGLMLRHTRPSRRVTPRVLLAHVTLALGTGAFLVLGLWPYR
jgi:hypothetical protein